MRQKEIVAALQNVLQLDPAEQILFAREYLNERAREEGRSEGRIEGRIEGQLMVIATLMHQRFGPLPEFAQLRLAGARAVEVDAMTSRILNAASIEEVLGEPKQAPKSKTKK